MGVIKFISANDLDTEEFYDEHKLSFPVLLDTNGETGARFGIRSIPTTLMLDKKGHIMGKALGPREWDSKKSVVLFEYLMDMGSETSLHGLKRSG